MKGAWIWAAFLLAAVACDPDDVPRFSPDGTRIAALQPGKDPGKEATAVALLDPEGREWRRTPLPDRWSAEALVWVGPRVWINAAQSSKPAGDSELRQWLLDPATGALEESKLKPSLLSTPFTGTWKGVPCLFIEESGKEGTRVRSLPDLKDFDTLPFNAMDGGHGWLVRDHDNRDVEVMSTGTAGSCRILRDEIGRACQGGPRKPVCSRVSPDGKLVVLAFDTDTLFRQAATEYTFGVYSMADGRLAWKGGANALRGLPVMVDDAVFALEAKSRTIHVGERTVAALGEKRASRSEPTSEVVMARHSVEGRAVVLELPLGKSDRAARYSASPDRKSFVLQIEGDKPRLIVVPIGVRVEATALREFPLPAP